MPRRGGRRNQRFDRANEMENFGRAVNAARRNNNNNNQVRQRSQSPQRPAQQQQQQTSAAASSPLHQHLQVAKQHGLDVGIECQCMICMEDFSALPDSPQRAQLIACSPTTSHMFCAGCIESVLKAAAQSQDVDVEDRGGTALCPQCRGPFRASQVAELPAPMKSLLAREHVRSHAPLAELTSPLAQSGGGSGGAAAAAAAASSSSSSSPGTALSSLTARVNAFQNRLRSSQQQQQQHSGVDPTLVISGQQLMRELDALNTSHQDFTQGLQTLAEIKQRELENCRKRASELEKEIAELAPRIAKEDMLHGSFIGATAKMAPTIDQLLATCPDAVPLGPNAGRLSDVNPQRACGGVTLDYNGARILCLLRDKFVRERARKGMRVRCDVVPNERKPGEYMALNLQLLRSNGELMVPGGDDDVDSDYDDDDDDGDDGDDADSSDGDDYARHFAGLDFDEHDLYMQVHRILNDVHAFRAGGGGGGRRRRRR